MRSDGASSPTAANKTEKERAGKLMDPLDASLLLSYLKASSGQLPNWESRLYHTKLAENHMRYSEQRLWTKNEKGKFGSSNISVRRQEDLILYQLNMLFSTRK